LSTPGAYLLLCKWLAVIAVEVLLGLCTFVSEAVGYLLNALAVALFLWKAWSRRRLDGLVRERMGVF
jgi:hypothetical protein